MIRTHSTTAPWVPRSRSILPLAEVFQQLRGKPTSLLALPRSPESPRVKGHALKRGRQSTPPPPPSPTPTPTLDHPTAPSSCTSASGGNFSSNAVESTLDHLSGTVSLLDLSRDVLSLETDRDYLERTSMRHTITIPVAVRPKGARSKQRQLAKGGPLQWNLTPAYPASTQKGPSSPQLHDNEGESKRIIREIHELTLFIISRLALYYIKGDDEERQRSTRPLDVSSAPADSIYFTYTSAG